MLFCDFDHSESGRETEFCVSLNWIPRLSWNFIKNFDLVVVFYASPNNNKLSSHS